MSTATRTIELIKVDRETVVPVQDQVSIEEPLEIKIVSGRERRVSPLSVTMRTPSHDEELAVGFLFTEGIIQKREHVTGINADSNNTVIVLLDPDLKISEGSLVRNFYTTSSCGVCGKASIDAVNVFSNKIISDLNISSEVLKSIPEKLLQSQPNFQTTGSLHASALFDKFGAMKLVREDVGRHNALDKLIGNQFLDGRTPLQDSILLVSGRTSFELIQKSAVAGISIVAAIGAPSSLAVELAEEKGITLVGFLKGERFNIYSHPNRIQFS